MSLKKHNFLTYEKCAGHWHYFIKLDTFVPFCGLSNGKITELAMTEFVDSNN